MQNEDIVRIAEEKQRKMRNDSIMKKKKSTLNEEKDSDDDIKEGTLQINTVKLQTAMAMKYYFHLTQMVFVHLLVFFYLPYKGNYNLHTSIDCDQRVM